MRPYVNAWLDKGRTGGSALFVMRRCTLACSSPIGKVMPNLSLRRRIYTVIRDDMQLI